MNEKVPGDFVEKKAISDFRTNVTFEGLASKHVLKRLKV